MVDLDPKKRITASEALHHPWFTIIHSQSTLLSTAQENMQKYNDKERFNMEKMKPEFSMVMCTPIMHALGPQGSPDIPQAGLRCAFAAQSPLIPRSNDFSTPIKDKEQKIEIKKEEQVKNGGILFRNLCGKSPLKNKQSSFRKKEEDDNTDFNEVEMDEKVGMNKYKANEPIIFHQFKDRKLPFAPGFSNKNSMSYLKSFATPMQHRRLLKEEKKINNSYFKKITETSKLINKILTPIIEEEKKIILVPSAEDNSEDFQTAMSHGSINNVEENKSPKIENQNNIPIKNIQNEYIDRSIPAKESI